MSSDPHTHYQKVKGGGGETKRTLSRVDFVYENNCVQMIINAI